MGILLGRIVSAFIGIFITKNKFKNIKWGVKKGSLAEFRILLKPALAFMAFPIGNAIFFQGLTILIGLYFSPAFLALYNTYRTLSRTVVQSVNVIAKSFGPEMSRKYGQSGFEPVWRLYRKGLLLTMIVSICIGVLLYFGGEIILLWWVGGKIKFNSLIFNGFLLASLINALWQVDMVCLTSLNKHGPMGATYLTASIAMVFTMVLINNSFGEIGSLLPIYLFEFIVGVFCYFSVRKLKNDNLKVLN